MRRRITFIALGLVCLCLLIAGGGYLWIQYTLSRSLSRIDGEIVCAGLELPVEIIRDNYGIPHIYAQNESDLFLAMGYAMAQDRLWQMEFHRRLGSGRVSELFGEDFIGVDRYFRMLTAKGMKKEILPELVPLARSFASGANAYIDTHRDRLPPEFILLGYRPEPWMELDFLPILKVVNWALSSGWKVDLTASEVLDRVGKLKFEEAFPGWPDSAPLIVPDASIPLARLNRIHQKIMRSAQRLSGLSFSCASNNWAVSGRRSVTGKPLLANDTHLGLSNPSFWWEVHLECPTIHAAGFCVPGVPGVSAGHNRHVAWGITNVMVDDVDFYIEKIRPENPNQYWYIDHWEDMETVEEEIHVKGKSSERIKIRLTRHGPVINPAEPVEGEPVVSARWTFAERPQPFRAAYLLLKAESIHDIRKALAHWELPGLNFVFADDAGNIGYWCCAAIPRRPKGDGLLPVPGWSGEYEWEGFVPFEEKPHLINPAEGFIATANSKLTGKGYPYEISRYWEPSDRIYRIHDMIGGSKTLSVEDMKRMQMDAYSQVAKDVTPKLIQAVTAGLTSDKSQKAVKLLAEWDFVMSKESVGACLFEAILRNMLEKTFMDELGEPLFKDYLSTPGFPYRAMTAMIRNGASPWFDDAKTPQTETMDDIISAAAEQAFVELEGLVGDKVEDWSWGRIHTLTFEHVLGKKVLLDRFFNLGPFPVDGSNHTVDKKQYDNAHPYAAIHGVSQRMIVDLSNPETALHVLPTGESGHLGSPHYADQIDLYLKGGYHPAWTTRQDVESHSEARLSLKPASE
ncbi:MAG: penicillin acylase family protein [Deltaproteobacteria bacterium]|nr:penicillin acylase family protein [Deltaproteobacteria bacterium]